MIVGSSYLSSPNEANSSHTVPMKDPKPFYEERIVHLESTIKKQKALLTYISGLRLVVFLATIMLVYVYFQNTVLAWGTAIIGTVSFLLLLRWYSDKKEVYELNKELLAINEEEIKILEGSYSDRYDGSDFLDPSHFYSSDIDLFGPGSFFQYLNRSGLQEGRRLLSDILKSNDIVGIERKQEAVKELSRNIPWIQKYMALARLTKTETPIKVILNWLLGYNSFYSKKIQNLPVFFGVISLILTLLSFLGILSFWYLGGWFFLGLAISVSHLKKNNILNAKTSKAKETIQQYALMLNEIEGQKFNSEILQKEKSNIESEGGKASKVFKSLSDKMDRFDSRNNILVALLGNGFFLWDLHCAIQIEKWIEKNRDLVEQWFRTVSFFDAYNSLATFGFNHPEYAYPKIVPDSEYCIQAEALGHPLVPKRERVSSDLSLGQQDFFVVTGANMAGKSTFLRTTSLFVVMSNVGLPVCAKKSSYTPIKLITSMRAMDSLADQSSYFFAELTRLQFIRKQLEKETFLVVLDEILKGTNSVDKAKGSRKLIENLSGLNVPGIIATHDLSLCEIAQHDDNVKNYFFETEIKNDELYFDYLLKEGVCQNMNASFLLKKMNIVT